MAESFTQHPLGWMEEHPYLTAAGVVGGVIVLYWLFFSGSGSSNTSNATAQTNMAAAYYAAEAQQATAGTQLNIAQDQMQAQMETAAIQTNGAVAINQANATAATQIAASQYQAGTDQATIWAGATNVQNNDAMATAASNNNYAYLTTLANNQANLATTAMQTIFPQELQLTGGTAAIAIPGMGSAAVDVQGTINPNNMAAQGYTPAQISAAITTQQGG